MRSLLEYMSCCCVTPEGSLNEEVLMAETPPKKKETKSSMPSDMVAPRKKNRVRVRITRSMNPQWKPSLFAITEDNVTADNRGKTLPEATLRVVDRVVKGKSTTGSRSKVHVRNNSNDMRPTPMTFMALPTFPATPSMF